MLDSWYYHFVLYQLQALSSFSSFPKGFFVSFIRNSIISSTIPITHPSTIPSFQSIQIYSSYIPVTHPFTIHSFIPFMHLFLHHLYCICMPAMPDLSSASVIHPLINSFIHSIPLINHSFKTSIHSFSTFIHSFNASIHSFSTFIHSMHPFICSFMHHQPLSIESCLLRIPCSLSSAQSSIASSPLPFQRYVPYQRLPQISLLIYFFELTFNTNIFLLD